MKKVIEQKIDEAIKKEYPIKLRAYSMLHAAQEGLRLISKKILAKYGKSDLIEIVYTSIKELALNASKANIKSLLFQEENIDMDNEHHYKKGMDLFKKKLNEKWVRSYARKCKADNIYVDVLFDYNKDRLITEVINNRPLSKKENDRIRTKFKNSRKYDSLARFYSDTHDDMEGGAGLGIVMVTTMLKAKGIDPQLFTIRSNFRNSTISKIEFPYHVGNKT